jgi:F-type H+-transporting ATPase subunit b
MRVMITALRAVVLAVVALAFAGAAMAEAPKAAAKDDGHATAKADAKKDDGHGHGEKKGGLSFAALERYDLGIFTLIVFGLLCAILFKFAWPKISEGLAKREANIAAVRDEAVKAKQDAEETRAKLQADLASAQDRIRAMMDEARRDADALRAKEREAGVKEAAAERDRAKREIESAKDAALADIYQQAVELATKLSSKTLARTVTADDHKRLLDESLAELKRSASA